MKNDIFKPVKSYILKSVLTCSNIDAEIKGSIMSIKNPISGQIKVDHADEIIMDDPKIDQSKIKIIQTDQD